MEETTQPPPDWLEMGAWVGRQQAFAVIAKKCSAAQALSLKQMKESCSYEKFGLSWEDFCQQHAGISRVHAERTIQQCEVFGEAYFRLSSLARISTEDYREIADNVVDNCIEIDGRQVPIIPENASVIRGFVRACRSRRAGPKAESSRIPDLELRLPRAARRRQTAPAPQPAREPRRIPQGHRLHGHPGVGPHRPPPGGDGSPRPLDDTFDAPPVPVNVVRDRLRASTPAYCWRVLS
jgi:hypothetical protein